jgi:hypothetical protein
MATPEEMERDSQTMISEFSKKMDSDPAFADAMRWFAALLRKWYLRAGYKRICQYIKAL